MQIASLSRRSLLGALALAATPARAQPAPAGLKRVDIGGGVRLACLDQGAGEPVVFVHGSLSDFSYWQDQLPLFAASHRAIAYSRRYNWPNDNPAQAGYSAVVDADDLAGLIEALQLAPAHIVGHSYGALTALFLATRRPELVRTITLAEPPAVSILAHLSPERAAEGLAMLADIEAHMVAPMRSAFARGDQTAGVAAFIDYVLNDPKAWAGFSAAAKAETLRDAHEWDMMLTTGELFPEIPPGAIAKIGAPVLQLSGIKSYPFLGLIDERIHQLLPQSHWLRFPNANHQMWLQEPASCRHAVLDLIAKSAG